MSTTPGTERIVRFFIHYLAAPARRFFSWWFGELDFLLPDRLRRLLVDRRDEVQVTLSADSVSIVRLSEQGKQENVLVLGGEIDALRRDIARCIYTSKLPPAVVYCLPVEKALHRHLSFPLAAEDNLRQVISFEMDRQTPFRAEQVYFDHRIIQRDPGANQLEVDLVLTPKLAVERDLDTLNQLGLKLDAMDIVSASSPKYRGGYNLLPKERRAVRQNTWLYINLFLVLVFMVMLGLVMQQSVTNRKIALTDLQHKVTEMEKQKELVVKKRNELKDALAGAHFLNEKKQEQGTLSDIFLDLTQRLSNETWLQSLSIRSEQSRAEGDKKEKTQRILELQGQSKNASLLIPVLKKSPYIESVSQDSVTPDSRTGKEQFVIRAKIRPKVLLDNKAEKDQGSTNAGKVNPAEDESKNKGASHANTP